MIYKVFYNIKTNNFEIQEEDKIKISSAKRRFITDSLTFYYLTKEFAEKGKERCSKIIKKENIRICKRCGQPYLIRETDKRIWSRLGYALPTYCYYCRYIRKRLRKRRSLNRRKRESIW